MLRSVDIQRQLEKGRILLKMTSCDTFDKIIVVSLRDLQLNQVFKHLTRCKNLQILFLSGNKVEGSDITQHMYKLKTLRKLDLSCNSLTELPRDPSFFSKMPNLEYLSLAQNDLCSLNSVRSLKSAASLRYLSLQGNPLEKLVGLSYRYDIVGMMPELYALDKNLVMFDEVHNQLDNRSIRYKSMNSFSRLSESLIACFVQGMSANQHLALLKDQMYQLRMKKYNNDPVRAIQRSRRASQMRGVISSVIKNQRSAVIRIQKHIRGWLCRVGMRKDMIEYFDSIGQIELTMTPDEVVRYRAIQQLKKGLKRMITKWRWWKLLTKTSTCISQYYNGWVTRVKLQWTLTGHLDLRKNPKFLFLTEQKYLIKHILQKQEKFAPAMAQEIFALLVPNQELILMKPVEIDLFDMPQYAISQMLMPATIVKVSKKKGRPKPLEQGTSILPICISQFGDKKAQAKQLENLNKLKNFYTHISAYERRVGCDNVIPQRASVAAVVPQVVVTKRVESSRVAKALRKGATIDSLLISSQSSEPQLDQSKQQPQQAYDYGDRESHQLQEDLLRQQQATSSFIQIDLKRSPNPDLASDQSIVRLITVFLQWNRKFPENAIHFYCGDTILRQVAVFRIQKWYRLVRRIKSEQKEIQSKQALQSHSRLTQLIDKPNQLNILQCLQMRRAAITIQQYWSMYRLKRRIRMLSSLKEYLGTVSSQTLCIEEHLYNHITDIQYSCLSNNTIPEAQCFAFDFVQSINQGSFKAWDLIFTHDSKPFTADCNAHTHEVVQERFKNQCLPNWVVKNNLALSQTQAYLNSSDRNNTSLIFHKTQSVRATEVLDYNQIVAPSNRTFSMNNGLRFVVLYCASVEDAQRRALALAMVTLNRKRGDFLKVLCPDQLYTVAFLQSITCWWKLPEIQRTVSPTLINDLMKPNGSAIQDLAKKIEPSHQGFVLSQQDYAVADQEQAASLLINRQLNDEDLQMKLVPARGVQPKNATLNIDIMDQNASRHFASTSVNSGVQEPSQEMTIQEYGKPYGQTDSTSKHVSTRQSDMLGQIQEYTSAIYVDEGGVQMNDKHVIIRNSNDSSSTMMHARNSTQSQHESTLGPSSKVTSSRQHTEANQDSALVRIEAPEVIRKSRPVSTLGITATVKATLDPSKNTQAYAIKSRKSLINSAYGQRKPPTVSRQQVKQGDSIISRAGQQQSQTTKADSQGAPPSSQSIQQIQSFGKLSLPKASLGESRVQSGVHLQVKTALNLNARSLRQDVYQDSTTTKRIGGKKALSSLQVRRPQTSIQQIQANENVHTLRDKNSLENFQITELKTDYQSSMAASINLNKAQSLRVGSAFQSQNRLATSTDRRLHTEQQDLIIAKMKTQRKSEHLLKQVQDLQNLTVKSVNVAKQRVVNQLIQNSIRTETDDKLRQISHLGQRSKINNQMKIFEDRSQLVVQNQIKTYQRAQSSYNVRSRQIANREQARRFSGAVNMLNKVNVEKARSQHRQNYLKTAKVTREQIQKPSLAAMEIKLSGAAKEGPTEQQDGSMYLHGQYENSTDSLPLTNAGTWRMRPTSRNDSEQHIGQPTSATLKRQMSNMKLPYQQRNIVVSKKNSHPTKSNPIRSRMSDCHSKSGVVAKMISAATSNRNGKEAAAKQLQPQTQQSYNYQSQMSYGGAEGHKSKAYDTDSNHGIGGDVEGSTPLYAVFDNVEAPVNIAWMSGQPVHSLAKAQVGTNMDTQGTLIAVDELQRLSGEKSHNDQQDGLRVKVINRDIKNDLLAKDQDFVTFQDLKVQIPQSQVRQADQQPDKPLRQAIALPVMAKEYQLQTGDGNSRRALPIMKKSNSRKV